MSWISGAILAVFTAAFVAFGLGFMSFADAVRTTAPPEPLPKADAIVALTGGSQARLETGVRLLSEKRGARLFISGVNRDVTDKQLFDLLKAPAEFRECCIELGRSAEDTIGNASETADWARRHNVRRLIVVTDDFHMPRSIAELRIAMPGVELIAYPVPTPAVQQQLWKTNMDAAFRLGGEYVKYLMISVRGFFTAPESKASATPANGRPRDQAAAR